MAHLQLQGLTKRYGAVTALDGVELAVQAGELLTLLGPSGCGKTTVLRLIAGFAPPTEGRILIDGVELAGTPPHRRDIGMVFQSYALFPHLTAARNIAFGLEERGLSRAMVRDRVAELLALVHMGDAAGRFPAELSGGQQQRIALARAVAYAPRVLLMDEPLGALDLKLREIMQLEIRRIQRELAITTLYVTHDQTEAMRISDRIAIMNGGRIEQLGTAREIYAAPQTRFVADFLGKINFIPARLALGKGGELVAQSPIGDVPIGPHDGLASGTAVTLGIRPDEVELGPASGDGGFRTRGIVVERSFLGTVLELRLRVGEGPILVVEARADGDASEVGREVALGWRGSRCKVFLE